MDLGARTYASMGTRRSWEQIEGTVMVRRQIEEQIWGTDLVV
jgi:hypothetical protein